MKTLYILFVIPVLGFSQTERSFEEKNYSRQKSQCEEQNKKDKIEYIKLKDEAFEMDFHSLTRAIIKDLDKRQFTRKYINFYYSSSQLSCGVIDPWEYECVREYNIKDPFYNRNSWTADDLIYLGNAFKDKVIIPSRRSIGFGLDESFYYVGEETDSLFSNFQKGKIKGEEKEFYYFSKKEKAPLAIPYTTGMDRLFFNFQNVLGYQVKVDQYLNGKKTVKTFEYSNGEWVKNE